MKHEPYPILGKILLLPVEQIHIEQDPFYHMMEQAIETLSEQIRAHGMLHPILVSMSEQHHYCVISDELLFHASVASGMTEVPSILIDCKEQDRILWQLAADGQQGSLHYLQRARRIRQLSVEHHLSIPEAADLLGLSLKEVSDLNKLCDLPEEIQETIFRENIAQEIAVILAQTPPEEQITLLNQIVSQRLTVEQLKEQIRREQSKQGMKGKIIIFKDTSVFTNTIDRAVTAMREAGIDSMCRKTASDRQIEYHITISKKPAGEAAHISTG